MKKSEYIYIGMDVHKETHTAVLMNSKEDKIGTIKIKNNIAGFKRLSAYVETFRQNLTPIYGLRNNREEMKQIEMIEADMLKELDYQLETMPGIKTVTASILVAQIGDIKRYKSADKLASFAGVSPIYQGSAGKGKNYQNKSMGNRELYSTLYLLAMQQVQVNAKGEARTQK